MSLCSMSYVFMYYELWVYVLCIMSYVFASAKNWMRAARVLAGRVGKIEQS